MFSTTVVLAVSLLTLVGCGAALQQVVPDESRQTLLPYLKDGKTTKQEIIERLGQPSRQFQGGRILTYRLGQLSECGHWSCEDKGLRAIEAGVTWDKPRPSRVDSLREVYGGVYTLVLVFNEADVLRKHSLIQIRGSIW